MGQVSLDVTLAGLPELPRPGEERFGTELVFSPGAFGTIAVGAARLGLKAAVAAPRPCDLAGSYVASVLADEGIDWLGEDVDRAIVTLVFPLAAERAMATYEPAGASQPPPAGMSANAFVLGPGDVARVPDEARAYVMTGSLDDRPHVERPSEALRRARALFANESEAVRLTGASSIEHAARELAAVGGTVVVTRGAAGAVACESGELVRVPAPVFDVRDTTGAGDLFAAAYVWADLRDLPLEERLRWAVLYASLSVRTVGAVPGAATLDELLEAGRRHRLSAV